MTADTVPVQSPPEKMEFDGIETIVVPEGREASWIKTVVVGNLSVPVSQCRRLKAAPPNTEANLRRYKDARIHLAWLHANLQITPEIATRTQIRKLLDLTINDAAPYLPEDIVHMATALHAKWDAEHWGSDDVIEAKEENNENAGASAAEDSTTTQGTDDIPTQQISLPSRDDPIFGSNGMMRGVLVARSANKGVKVYILNPDVPRISARVFGHNNLQVGTWFPLQIAALARGAHGSKMGGIYGNVSEGTYSIVTSQMYHDLDRDEGEILYYSGSNSHSNDDPSRPAPSSGGTKALKVSMITRKPVRVLRSGGAVSVKNTNRLAPSCGIRYDGLYEVLQMLTPRNTRGGMYEQFKLVRLPGQMPLDEIRRTIPSRYQVDALERLQSK